MEPRVQIVALATTALLLFGVLELVRRRKLLERYALLWLFSAGVLLALAAWTGLLDWVARVVGISYAPSALFVIAFGFILLLLLHFSIATSRLSDQTKVLAQRLALLEERLRHAERRAEAREEKSTATAAEYDDEHDEPAPVVSRAGRR
jgi:hypothetical protein